MTGKPGGGSRLSCSKKKGPQAVCNIGRSACGPNSGGVDLTGPEQEYPDRYPTCATW